MAASHGPIPAPPPARRRGAGGASLLVYLVLLAGCGAGNAETSAAPTTLDGSLGGWSGKPATDGATATLDAAGRSELGRRLATALERAFPARDGWGRPTVALQASGGRLTAAVAFDGSAPTSFTLRPGVDPLGRGAAQAEALPSASPPGTLLAALPQKPARVPTTDAVAAALADGISDELSACSAPWTAVRGPGGRPFSRSAPRQRRSSAQTSSSASRRERSRSRAAPRSMGAERRSKAQRPCFTSDVAPGRSRSGGWR